MLERHKLSNGLDVGFRQMCDYIKLSISQGCPFEMIFEIDLSDEDIDLIIEKLKKAKQSRKTERDEK